MVVNDFSTFVDTQSHRRTCVAGYFGVDSGDILASTEQRAGCESRYPDYTASG